MKYWKGWYDDPNPFRVAGSGFVNLFPAFFVAGEICLIAIFAITTPWPLISELQDIFEISFVLLFYVTICSFLVALSGLVWCFLISVFDYSMGKVLSPALFRCIAGGATVVPFAFLAMLRHNEYLELHANPYFYAYLASVTAIGGSCGVLFCRARFMSDSLEAFAGAKFSIRQLMATTFWVAIVFALRLNRPLFVLSVVVFCGTIFVVYFVWARLHCAKRHAK